MLHNLQYWPKKVHVFSFYIVLQCKNVNFFLASTVFIIYSLLINHTLHETCTGIVDTSGSPSGVPNTP